MTSRLFLTAGCLMLKVFMVHSLATLVSPRTNKQMQAGEGRVMDALVTSLDDEILVWHDIPFGPECKKPDFVVLDPTKGILVLEVKDWKQETLVGLNKDTATIKSHQGQDKVVTNPLKQAREYAETISRILQQDPQLVKEPNDSWQGTLCFPFAFAVGFTRMTRKQLEQKGVFKVIPGALVFCKHDFEKHSDKLQKKLFEDFPFKFKMPKPLIKVQIDRIRGNLYPEVRIDRNIEYPDSPSKIEVMDIKLEKLARNLGPGHRVMHGVAGSGKTSILVSRARFLAETTDAPILVLCYNKMLAKDLHRKIKSRRDLDCCNVSVLNFHLWCLDTLKEFGLPRPSNKEYRRRHEYAEELVKRVVGGVAQGAIPTGRYHSILIDELHDFDPDWVKLLVKQVDQRTKSMLFVYDDAQRLYRHAKWCPLNSMGIQAQGRTTILRTNHRNTAEILQFASEVVTPLFFSNSPEGKDDFILTPRSAGRHGPVPIVEHVVDFESELQYVADTIHKLILNGTVAMSDIAILSRTNESSEKLADRLASMSHELVSSNQSFEHMRFLTMHSSKGLEFPLVFVRDLDRLRATAEDLRLLYVAMTRSTERLVMIRMHNRSERSRSSLGFNAG